MPWLCSKCGLNNSVDNRKCADDKCNEPRPAQYDNASRSLMEQDRAELHAQFFHHESILVKDMDYVTLKTHREELERIAFEARARITAVDAEQRLRDAQLTKGQRKNLISRINPDPLVTDAISIVGERKKRMSKLDKLLLDMKSIGVENAEELVKNIERKATTKQIGNITFNSAAKKSQAETAISGLCAGERHDECVGRFMVGVTSYLCACNCHNQKTAEPSAKPPEPFDPSSLFGK